MPNKTVVFLGLAFGVLMMASRAPGAEGLVSLWWLVLAYALMVIGEMMLSPIGLSAVTTLSVPRVVGLMMGAWFLFSAFGEMIAGRLGTWASIDPNPDGSFDKVKALGVYGDVFGDIFGAAAGRGPGRFLRRRGAQGKGVARVFTRFKNILAVIV